MTKAELYTKIHALKYKFDFLYNIKFDDYPYDLFGLLDMLTVENVLTYTFMPFKTNDLRGMVHIAENSRERHVILINQNLSDDLKPFVACHELMHTEFCENSRGVLLQCFEKVKVNQDSYTEWIANEGAAEMLVPYKTFIPYFCQLLDLYINHPEDWIHLYSYKDVFDVLAQTYGITYPIAMNRTNSLSYEIDQYRVGVPLDGIELLSKNQRDVKGIFSTDYISLINSVKVRYEFDLPCTPVIQNYNIKKIQMSL